LRVKAGRLALLALVACGGCAALGLCAGWCGRAWWVLDLAAHFRVPQLALLCLAAIGLALLRAWRWMGLFLAFLVAGGWPLLPYWFGGDAAREGGRRLRVASLNILSGNRDTQAMRRFVRESRADVLLLIEVDRGTIDALEPELREYGQRLELPRPDPFGIALFSRIPMRAQRVAEPGGAPASIRAELDLGGRPVRLAALHAPPPVAPDFARLRDSMIEGAASWLCRGEQPGILLGDLNTTPWAESLPRLAYARGLRDARRGHGLLPSWPVDNPLARIAIDHCLVRGKWRVLDFHLGEDCGSDHLGIAAELALDP
jgi:endonuclease/exonuclease/phosphatase (EEP) superfamily protein YafD